MQACNKITKKKANLLYTFLIYINVHSVNENKFKLLYKYFVTLLLNY